MNKKRAIIGLCTLIIGYAAVYHRVPAQQATGKSAAGGSATSTPIVIPQTPTIVANVYLANALPIPFEISYTHQGALPDQSFTNGPAIIQPGQAIKVFSCNVKSTLQSGESYQFITTLNGSLGDKKNSLQCSLMQRIINTNGATSFEYALKGTIPELAPEWTSTEHAKSSSVTIGQTKLFFDYIAQEGEKSTNIMYCLAPKAVSLTSSTIQNLIGRNFERASELPARIWNEMFSPSSSALKQPDTMNPARPELRYDQSCFLGTHHSFANIADGFLYATQLWGIKKQLDVGVRVFELDVYPDESTGGLLCMRTCALSRYLRKGKNQAVSDFLRTIKTWLDANPKEVLTIMLNNHLPADATLRLFTQAGLVPLMLTKEMWEPVNRGNLWPRIGWLQIYKKQLIVFDRSDVDCQKYAYPAKHYLVHNTPGTFDITQAAKQSPPVVKPIPNLFECCYYGTLDAPLPLHNTPEQLKKLLAAIKQNNYLNPNQIPNFIMLDHIELGNPIALVNELNKAGKS